jgi:fructose-specific phosphotransferase system IIC component
MWFPRPDSLVNIAHLSKFMFGGPWSVRSPLATIPSMALGGGRRSWPATIHGANIKTSHSGPWTQPCCADRDDIAF